MLKTWNAGSTGSGVCCGGEGQLGVRSATRPGPRKKTPNCTMPPCSATCAESSSAVQSVLPASGTVTLFGSETSPVGMPPSRCSPASFATPSVRTSARKAADFKRAESAFGAELPQQVHRSGHARLPRK